jgi:hypothetical protein
MTKFESAEVTRARAYIRMGAADLAARSLAALWRSARTTRSQHAIRAAIDELVPGRVDANGIAR